MRWARCQHQLSLFYIIFAVFITSLKLYNRNSLQEWCICLNTKKMFSTWRLSAILSVRKSSRDLYLHVILHLRSQFRINWPIWCRDIAKNTFRYGARPLSWIWKISIFCQNGNLHLWTKFDNLDNSQLRYDDKAIFNMAAVRHLEFAKIAVLAIWPMWFMWFYMILHFLSEFRINRPIWCRDIAKKRFSIWRLSAILNLKNFDSFVKCPSMEWKLCVMTSSYCTRKLYFMFPTLC